MNPECYFVFKQRKELNLTNTLTSSCIEFLRRNLCCSVVVKQLWQGIENGSALSSPARATCFNPLGFANLMDCAWKSALARCWRALGLMPRLLENRRQRPKCFCALSNFFQVNCGRWKWLGRAGDWYAAPKQASLLVRGSLCAKFHTQLSIFHATGHDNSRNAFNGISLWRYGGRVFKSRMFRILELYSVPKIPWCKFLSGLYHLLPLNLEGPNLQRGFDVPGNISERVPCERWFHVAPSYGKLCVKYCVLIDRCITTTVIDVTSTPMHGQWLSRSFLQMWAGSCATYRRQLYWCSQTDFFHHDEKMNPSLEMAVQVIFGCVDFNLGVFLSCHRDSFHRVAKMPIVCMNLLHGRLLAKT